MPSSTSRVPAAGLRARRWLLRARANIRRVGLQEPRVLPGDRLLTSPTFILSSVRSGSTLLRVMLNSHSQIHAPHELHLRGVGVNLTTAHAAEAMAELGLSEDQLQFLLWDRILHRALAESGKRVLVEKTPSNAVIWRQIVRCWPDARFIFLLRHPASVAASWQRTRKHLSHDEIAGQIRYYMNAVEDARTGYPGLTVRYEDVTADPERTLGEICDFVGVPYEPAMLDYSTGTHGEFRSGLGDWSRKLQSGRVHPIRQLPTRDQVPTQLVEIAEKWGYFD